MLIAKHLQITRNASEALHETVLAREDSEELFLTATPLAGEGLAPMLARVGRRLRQRPWRVVGMTVFAGATPSARREEVLRGAFGVAEWPVTWLESEGDSCNGPAGIEVHAVSGLEVRTIRLRARTVGCAWEDATARHCELGDVTAQVELTMRVVRAILKSRGMDWAHVTRGVAYFRQPTDMGSFLSWCQANKVRNMPVIVSHHTVCRDDLLYEIEIDAVAEVD